MNETLVIEGFCHHGRPLAQCTQCHTDVEIDDGARSCWS